MNELRKLQAFVLTLTDENYKLHEQNKELLVYKEIATNGLAKYATNPYDFKDHGTVRLNEWFEEVLDIAFEVSDSGVDEQDASCIEHETIQMQVHDMISKVKSSCVNILDIKIVYVSSEISNYIRHPYNQCSCIQKALRELLDLFTGAEEFHFK